MTIVLIFTQFILSLFLNIEQSVILREVGTSTAVFLINMIPCLGRHVKLLISVVTDMLRTLILL